MVGLGLFILEVECSEECIDGEVDNLSHWWFASGLMLVCWWASGSNVPSHGQWVGDKARRW